MSDTRKETVTIGSTTPLYLERGGVIQAYLNDIKDYCVLSDMETRKLIYIAQNGKTPRERKQATDKVVLHNQRFIISIVKKWAMSEHFLDLVEEANLGLIHAIGKYKVSSRTKFLSYAVHWIGFYIREYIATKQNCVHPNNAYRLYHHGNYIRHKFWKEHGRFPTREEMKDILVKRYNISVPDSRDLDIFQRFTYNGMTDIESNHGIDSIPIEYRFTEELSNNNVVEAHEQEEIRYKVEGFLSVLDVRERMIMEMYHGLNDEEPKTFAEIASHFALSTERARQIYQTALKKCKRQIKHNK